MKSNAQLSKFNSVYANYESTTSSCIQVFIDYINTKYRNKGNNNLPIVLANTDAGNVIENLITLMMYKGFPNINITNVTELYRNFFYTDSFDRKTLFDAIEAWSGKKFDPPYTSKQMRDKLTIAGSSLSKATEASIPGQLYIINYDDSNNKNNIQLERLEEDEK